MTSVRATHLRVAVVDDDTTLLAMLNELLTDEGYVVSSFSDGIHAQKAAYHSGFDLVLTDVNMPGLSGIELLRYLREIGSKAVVIIMTANADLQSAIEAVRLGAFDFLTKPFDDIHNVVKLVNKAADKILGDMRHEQMVQAVIEKTKQIIAYQKPQNLTDDLKDLVQRTDQLVRDLQPHAAGENYNDQPIAGNLQDLGLANLLQMLSVVGKSGVLLLHTHGVLGDLSGEVWFTNGRIVQIRAGRVRRAKALSRLLVQEKGEFRFMLVDDAPDDEVQTSTDGLILDCLRCLDEFRRLGPRVPPAELYLRIKPPLPKDLQEADRQTLEMIMRYSKVGDVIDYSSAQDVDVINSLIRLRLKGVLDVYYAGNT